MISTKKYGTPEQKIIFRNRLAPLFPKGVDRTIPSLDNAYTYLISAKWLAESDQERLPSPAKFKNAFNPNNESPVFGGDLILWARAFQPKIESVGLRYSEDYFDPGRVNTTPVGSMRIRAVGEIAKMDICQRRQVIFQTMLRWMERTVEYGLISDPNGFERMSEAVQNQDLMDALTIMRLSSVNFNEQPGDLDAVKRLCDGQVARWEKIV